MIFLKNIKPIVYFLILMVNVLPVCAQQEYTQNDRHIFTAEAFITLIKQNNPIAKIADIQTEKAAAELQSARGNFDPLLEYNGADKTFGGSKYYRYHHPEITLPTPIGIDLKTGFENNEGKYQNPELSGGVSSYIGLEISVLKGLLLDNRRAALRQAKILMQQSEQDRLQIVNHLLYDALNDYWIWAGNYRLFQIYNDYVTIADKRLKLIKNLFENGNMSMADTVEAATQLQNYQLQRSEASLKLNNAQLILSNYLWTENQGDYMLPQHYIPDTQSLEKIKLIEDVNTYVNQSATDNPSLRAYNFKIKGLEVEQKLKKQSLLPTLKIKANLLSKNYYQFPNELNPYLENNYKWGIEFNMPLFFRTARGDYRKAKLKIQETQLELQNKTRETENKIKYYHNNIETLQKQIGINEKNYQNYLFMLKNENLRFKNGESSLFLINSRESKVLASLEKQIELYIKHQQSQIALQWSTGLLR